MQHLASQGYERVVTGALAPEEQAGFLEAGFSVYEHLHLLLLDPSRGVAPVPPGPGLRRAGPRRRRQLLEVDRAAFSASWRLDAIGLRQALEATSQHRLRVVLWPRRKVGGYVICGASGRRGFVQRLAVAPEAQGHGLGKRLLLDGVHWLCDMGVAEVAVNTQEGNRAALALYRSAGFRDDPVGLGVLAAPLGPAVTGLRR
jgi:ribosomal protein S18 acetylase RimI-like enzyme